MALFVLQLFGRQFMAEFGRIVDDETEEDQEPEQITELRKFRFGLAGDQDDEPEEEDRTW